MENSRSVLGGRAFGRSYPRVGTQYGVGGPGARIDRLLAANLEILFITIPTAGHLVTTEVVHTNAIIPAFCTGTAGAFDHAFDGLDPAPAD